MVLNPMNIITHAIAASKIWNIETSHYTPEFTVCLSLPLLHEAASLIPTTLPHGGRVSAWLQNYEATLLYCRPDIHYPFHTDSIF